MCPTDTELQDLNLWSEAGIFYHFLSVTQEVCLVRKIIVEIQKTTECSMINFFNLNSTIISH